MKTRKYNRYRKYFNKRKTRGVQKRYNKRTNNKRTNNKRTNKYKRKNTIRIHRRNFNKTKRKKGGAIPVGALPVIAVGAVALLAAIGGPIIGTYLDEASHDKEAKQKEEIGRQRKMAAAQMVARNLPGEPVMKSVMTDEATEVQKKAEGWKTVRVPEDVMENVLGGSNAEDAERHRVAFLESKVGDESSNVEDEYDDVFTRAKAGLTTPSQREMYRGIGNRARNQSEEMIKNSPYWEEGEDGVAKPILDDP